MKKIFYFMAILFSFASCALPEQKNEVAKTSIPTAESYDETGTLKSDEVKYDVYDISLSLGRVGHGNRVIVNDRCVVITIDSCEYLYIENSEFSDGGSLSHKGNCKYCAERHKKEIEAAVRKSLNQNNYSNYGKSETDDSMPDLW